MTTNLHPGRTLDTALPLHMALADARAKAALAAADLDLANEELALAEGAIRFHEDTALPLHVVGARTATQAVLPALVRRRDEALAQRDAAVALAAARDQIVVTLEAACVSSEPPVCTACGFPAARRYHRRLSLWARVVRRLSGYDHGGTLTLSSSGDLDVAAHVPCNQRLHGEASAVIA